MIQSNSWLFKDGRDMNTQKTLFTGVVFIVTAFMCLLGVFYMIVQQKRDKETRLAEIQQEMAVLDTEKNLVQNKVFELSQTAGREIELERVLERVGDEEFAQEQARQEGDLWIDRSTGSWVITLGALNGVASGQMIGVYDDEKRVGTVKVQTVLDVISYVQPFTNEADFTKVVYRVVIQ
jgi:hypothetical protein